MNDKFKQIVVERAMAIVCGLGRAVEEDLFKQKVDICNDILGIELVFYKIANETLVTLIKTWKKNE